ncbi:hypothetical protein CF65_02929 [Aggregatibacter actinomycetemcomitans HK1651]|nr:hypothetical protein CF65_02929 [Aggregatibacter actinomycetemcomitans HK1651]
MRGDFFYEIFLSEIIFHSYYFTHSILFNLLINKK